MSDDADLFARLEAEMSGDVTVTDPTPDPVEDDEPDDGIAIDVDPHPTTTPPLERTDTPRRPLLPAWMTDRDTVKAAAPWYAGNALHATTFHTIRLPIYTARLCGRAPIGVGRILAAWWRWCGDESGRQVAAELTSKDAETYIRLAAQRRSTIRGRAVLSLLMAAVAVFVVTTATTFPPADQALIAALVLLALGYAGRSVDHPVTSRAVDSNAVPRLTSELVLTALGSLGIGELNKAITKGDGVRFPSPITRDGPGWRADIDLPPGVTAGDVIERRDRLASGLRRPLGCVWPEVDPDAHAGRLILWVGDKPLAAGKPVVWPLAKAGKTNLFETVPLGVDQRGRAVAVTLMFASGVCGAIPRSGKALALDTPVPTPTGWSTMGDLKAGDQVFDETGAPCTVTDAWPVRYDRPCYEVVFSDGTTVVADAEHLWQVDDLYSRRSSTGHGSTEPRVLMTQEMVGSFRRKDGLKGRANYSVRVAGQLECADATGLTIPPYVLGVWLGDGNNNGGLITSPEPEMPLLLEKEGETVELVPSTVACEGGCPGYRVAGLTTRLRAAGLLHNKHIPIAYLRGSVAQRRELLAGLLDTDGWCSAAQGSVQFSGSNERLVRDVLHLVSTLGYQARLSSKPARLNGRDYGTSWTVSFTPPDRVFALDRKADRQATTVSVRAKHRYITDIRPVPSVPVRCITVDSPNSLYLVTQACIPTHNTFALRLIGLAGALDPRTELHAYNLKGGSDFDPLAAVAHAYRTGDDQEDIEYLLRDMRSLAADRRRRYKVLRGLPRDVCPESKVTDELANRRDLGLHPVLVIIDECQLAFEHPEHGDELTRLVTDLVKAGPAVGIMVWCATQRPDAKSLPRDISANAVLRLALKLGGQLENDMVLGTSAYKNGVRATMLSRRDRGVAILAGEGDDPCIVRISYVDGPDAEAITARARAARKLAGLLTGHAAGIDPEADVDTTTVLDHLIDVWPAKDHRVWCDDLATALATAHPGRYDGWTGEQVTAAVKPHGISTVQVKRTFEGRPINKRGLDLGAVREALAERGGAMDGLDDDA